MENLIQISEIVIADNAVYYLKNPYIEFVFNGERYQGLITRVATNLVTIQSIEQIRHNGKIAWEMNDKKFYFSEIELVYGSPPPKVTSQLEDSFDQDDRPSG